MDTPKKYTCIKPTTHQYQKVSVGDELELTPEQARPLQHGGFITFDEDAAKCIRQLAKGDDTAVSVDTPVGDEPESESTNNPIRVEQTTQTIPAGSSSVGFERGD